MAPTEQDNTGAHHVWPLNIHSIPRLALAALAGLGRGVAKLIVLGEYRITRKRH